MRLPLETKHANIGFDFDGVFIPDIPYDPSKDMRALRLAQKPQLTPSGAYVIVTGRPKQDAAQTDEWVDLYLTKNPPVAVYHGKYSEYNTYNAMQHKINVINSLGLEAFIESCPIQAAYIQKYVKAKVFVWEFLVLQTQDLQPLI